MANGMTTEVIEKSVQDLLNNTMLKGQSNHAYHEMAPQFVVAVLKSNGLDEQLARRIQFDVLYISEIVRGFGAPKPLGKLAFKQDQIEQFAAQIRNNV